MPFDVTKWRLVLLVLATATVIAAGDIAAMNLHTTASAWRAVDPSASAGPTLTLPAKRPAQDRRGAPGWSWLEGTPGWRPGQTMKGFLVAGLKPADIQRARRDARAPVDRAGLRVVDAMRASRSALLAILAAPAANDPNVTCLATMFHPNEIVRWWCPNADAGGQDRAAPILVATMTFRWPQTQKNTHALYLVGVARGDVRRVVLEIPGLPRETLYRRGRTWGQFDAARTTADGRARLRVYGRGGLLETVRLTGEPGSARTLR
jgi:hypothetical protein